MKNKFEIYVDDAGDPSVGLQGEQTLKAELSDNFVNQLKNDGTLREFEARLKALVEEFCQPDTYYETYNTEILDAEFEFYKRMNEGAL